MPLRRQLEAVKETIQEVELAAAQKFIEGQQLVINGRFGGGIYLLGYSAEILLKNACARYNGAAPSDIMIAACDTLLNKQFGSTTFKGAIKQYVDLESKHSVQFWTEVLIAVRTYKGDGFDPLLQTDLRRHTDRIYENWWVEMRYRQDRASSIEAKEMIEDVAWINSRYPQLLMK